MGIRKGFTSGTCAQAAVKGACIMLTERKHIENIEVLTPCGIGLRIKLTDQEIGRDFARCAVIKDSGDDPDVTSGAKIFAAVKLSAKKGITIKGGKGVGKVTKPGLAVSVGDWAINPVPRRMILAEASKFLPEVKGLTITISVPAGEELAKKTFNPKLGIVGGISIIGTTGIVEPRSLDAYKASLALELDVLKAQGYNNVVFVLGYVGEKFYLSLREKQNRSIKIGDHIGFMLEEAAKRKIKEVLLVGHIGKLVKVTHGQFNTHCNFGDQRLESIARYAEGCGASRQTREKILSQKTAEAAVVILKEAGLSAVFDAIARDVEKKSVELVKNKMDIKCILLSLNGEVLSEHHEKKQQ